MKFSVVTISFNQADFLERTIRSVISQTGVDLEYIIVDPGSTDGSRDIIERYRDHFAHVIYEKDKGPPDGLNKGLALATGTYFYYLNSDDEVLPGAFAEAARYLADDPVDVLYANGYAIDREGKILRPIYSAPFVSVDLCVRGLATIIQQSSFVRTATLRHIGGFNVANCVNWDGEVFFDIARAGGSFRRVWRRWGRFRIYGTSITGSGKYTKRINEEYVRMGWKLSRDYDSLYQHAITWVLWFFVRLLDWRRGPSYLRGPLKPSRLGS